MSGALGEALTVVRDDVVRDIAVGMRDEGFLGIMGEPLVGKTTLVRKAAAMLEQTGEAKPVVVEVVGAYSIAKLVARWRHALLRAVVGPIAASHAAALPSDFWPGSTTGALLAARELFGDDYDAALSDVPRKDETAKSFAHVLDLTVRVTRKASCVLVFDHIEAPLLTFKHPISPYDLLWEVRATAQHLPGLHVAVLCSPTAAEHLVAGPDGAYYGDGRWVRIPPPRLPEWRAAHERADITFDPELVRLADGHVPTMFLLSDLIASTGKDPSSAFRLAAGSQHEHAARCLQHATSLHRLGAHVLIALANGDGPYAATPDARSDDVARAVRQLALAGLIRREHGSRLEDTGPWRLTDPLVRWLLAEPMNVEPHEPMPELK